MLGVAQSALEPVMTGLYALANVPAVTALAPIFDEVPQGTPCPYIALESPTETPDNTMHEYAKAITVQFHIVSQARGDQESLRILSALYGVLDYTLPVVPNFVVYSVKGETPISWKEDVLNGVLTRHIVWPVRVLCFQST